MTKSNIIAFPGPTSAETAAVLRDSVNSGHRRKAVSGYLVTAVEAAVTAVIGLCIVTCTIAVLFMV